VRYYIRQKNGRVSGPYDLSVLKEYVKAGKIREDMEFSVDRRDWMWGIEIAELFPMDARPARRRRPRRA
jgi:hypothetical protein